MQAMLVDEFEMIGASEDGSLIVMRIRLAAGATHTLAIPRYSASGLPSAFQLALAGARAASNQDASSMMKVTRFDLGQTDEGEVALICRLQDGVELGFSLPRTLAEQFYEALGVALGKMPGQAEPGPRH